MLEYLQSINLTQVYYQWGQNDTTLFEKQTAHKTFNEHSNTSEIDFYTKYYDKELANKVLNAYDADYKLFNLPKPKWLSYVK